MTVVLDASFAIALLRPEEGSGAARRAIDRWLAEGIELAVPTPLWVELVNALMKKHRRSGSQVIEALFELDQLGLITVEVDRPTLIAVLDLVETSGLTAHDATYLAVARATGDRLATFDHELIAAGGPDVIDMWADRGPEPGVHRPAETPAPYARDEGSPTWPSWPGAGSYLATLRRQAMAGR